MTTKEHINRVILAHKSLNKTYRKNKMKQPYQVEKEIDETKAVIAICFNKIKKNINVIASAKRLVILRAKLYSLLLISGTKLSAEYKYQVLEVEHNKAINQLKFILSEEETIKFSYRAIFISSLMRGA